MSDKKRLGSDPFAFIQKTGNKVQREQKPKETEPPTVEKKESWTRATFIVREKYAEKLRDIAYWDRVTLKEVLDEALGAYIQRRERKEKIQPREGGNL
jgi:hypothetical protein